MLKHMIRYSFLIMLFIAIFSAASFDDICRDHGVDLHDVFSMKMLSISGFIIIINIYGHFNLKQPAIQPSSHYFSIFHPPKIS